MAVELPVYTKPFDRDPNNVAPIRIGIEVYSGTDNSVDKNFYIHQDI